MNFSHPNSPQKSILNRMLVRKILSCDKHKDEDHADVLIESEDIFDLFRMLSEEHFNNHKKFYNKEYKYQDKEVK